MGIALDELSEKDKKVTANGIDIIYDEREEQYVADTIIDFEKSFFGKGFTVRSSAYGSC
ncbi:MAG: hypothetical protein GY866_35000 [Proteobacteria bacterium]|nr:hypothetical protein [Pseudomonadota bacterium]